MWSGSYTPHGEGAAGAVESGGGCSGISSNLGEESHLPPLITQRGGKSLSGESGFCWKFPDHVTQGVAGDSLVHAGVCLEQTHAISRSNGSSRAPVVVVILF